jgi:hypothetical protein
VLPRTAGQTECLLLGNGPSLLGRPFADVPRERVFILGLNQSWRAVGADGVDAHFAIDYDQYDFDNPEAAGYGGRDYYMALHKRRAAFHTGSWANFGTALDSHQALVFSRRPFQKRWRGAHPPPLAEDGGVCLKPDASSGKGSIAYAALQLVFASGFDLAWMVGIDMGQNAKKFDGANGYTGFGKRVPTNVQAWSNSDHHDQVWRFVPDDVRSRVRVIEPSATKVLPVTAWPWEATA